MQGYRPTFFRLVNGGEAEKRIALLDGEERFDTTIQNEFAKIPGSPVAYWVSSQFRSHFRSPRSGQKTIVFFFISADTELPIMKGIIPNTQVESTLEKLSFTFSASQGLRRKRKN